MEKKTTTIEISITTLDALIERQQNIDRCTVDEAKRLLNAIVRDLKVADEMELYCVCDECHRITREGYVIEACEFYCSTKCLHKHVSEEEFQKLYADGEGDSYYTDWY